MEPVKPGVYGRYEATATVGVLLGIIVVVFGTKWIFSPSKTTDATRPVITTTFGSGSTTPISRKVAD